MNLKLNRAHDKLSFRSPENKAPEMTGWRPSYLRKRVLVAFAICFVGMIAALEALYQVSSANSGIASSTQSRRYTWTYGPTAILTVVAAFWSRVEFQAKQIAPWQSMLKRPEKPQKSVLLDYISEMQPVSLFKAAKNKHFGVAAGVACSVLLRILIVFSTGLFSLQQVQILKRDFPIQVQGSVNSLNPSMLAAATTQPFDIINGIVFENVSYPVGTTANFTFPTFSVSNFSSGATVTTNISGLAADLDCEPARDDKLWLENILRPDPSLGVIGVEVSPSRFEFKIHANQLYTPSCRITNVTISIPTDVDSLDPRYVGTLAFGQCDGMNSSHGNRIVMILAEAHISRSADYTNSNIILKRSVQMICKPTYSILTLQAKASTSNKFSTVDLTHVERDDFTTLPSLTAWDIAKNILAVTAPYDNLEPIEYHEPFFDDPKETKMDVDWPLGIAVWLAGAAGNIDNSFKAGVLRDGVSSYYRAMAAQLVHIGLEQQNELTTNGSAVINENRVMINQLPLRVMEAFLAIGILLAGVMITLVQRDTLIPWNPNHISAIAAIMARSKAFRESLYEASTAPLEVLAERLGGRRYYSEHTEEYLSIAAVDDTFNDRTKKDKDSFESADSVQEWKPFPNLIVRIVAFITVAMVIAALEIGLHLSQRNRGLGDASSTETMHYLWTMLPALIMVIIGLFFTSMDFSTRCLAPYARLKHRTGAAFEQFMTVTFLDSLDTTNILNSIHLRYFAVLATTLATIISSFLTIVTSGLYSTVDVPLHISTNFTQGTTFFGACDASESYSIRPDQKFSSSSIDGENQGSDSYDGIMVAKYILRDGLPFPRWTYDELAFPKLLITSNDKLVDGQFLDIRVPAMRATLICRLQTGAELEPKIIPEMKVLNFSPLNALCDSDGKDLGLKVPEYFEIPGININGGVFGTVYNYPCQSTDNKSSTSTGSTTLRVSDRSLFYVWGSFVNNTIEHVASLTCGESAEMVDTQTRFQLPEFNVVDDHPPVPDESSARPAENFTEPPDWANLDYDEVRLDSFFQTLLDSKFAISEEDLGLADRNEKVIQAIKRQHKIYKAQLFNRCNRISTNGTLDNSPLLGNVTTAGHLGLVQDAASTRILEAFLATMLALGILGSVLMNTDHVLPKNPCSIAAVASLLADSNFLYQYEKYVGNPNDKSVGKALFAHCRFFFGWGDYESMNKSNSDKFTIHLIEYVGEKDIPEGWI